MTAHLTTIYDIDSESANNFLYGEPMVIDVDGAKIQPSGDPTLYVEDDIANQALFSFDPLKLEHTGEQFQQVTNISDAITSIISFRNNINVDWNNNSASLIGTATGGASVVNGKLDLSYNTRRFVSYDPLVVRKMIQQGCIRFKYTPFYNSAPAPQDCILFELGGASYENRITLEHRITGSLWLIVSNSNGNVRINQNLLTWAAVLDREYEIEIDFDFVTLQNFYVYIDGTRIATVPITLSTRTTAVTNFQIGARYGRTTDISIFKMRSFQVFDTIQHTGASYVVSDIPTDLSYKYLPSYLDFPRYLGLEELTKWVSFLPTSLNVKFTLNALYYSSGEWRTSNNTEAQSNDLTTIQANFASLPADNSLSIRAFFLGSDTVKGNISNLQVVYSTVKPWPEYSTLLTKSPVILDGLYGVSTTSYIPIGTDIRFTLVVGGIEKYHNGAAWVASDGTLAKTNDIVEISANVLTAITSGTTLQIKAYLVPDNEVTPVLSSIIVNYDFFEVLPDSPIPVMLFGNILELTGEAPTEGEYKLDIVLPTSNFVSGSLIVQSNIEVTPDVDGYFEQSIVGSSDDYQYGFYLVYTYEGEEKRDLIGFASIPNQYSVNISDLTFYKRLQ